MKWKLYKGDCLEHLKTLEDKSIDMILTDPPYNINFKPQRKNVKSRSNEAIENDDMSPEEFTAWLDSIVYEMDRVLKDDSYIFMFSGWSTIYQFHPVLMKYWTVKAIHIWKKNMFGIGYYSRPQYEPFFMCLKGKPEVPKVAPSDVWEYKKVHPNDYEVLHSCQKPEPLLSKIISTYGKPGMKILDPFAGSGSLGEACHSTDTIPIMMEMDPVYIDMIEKKMKDKYAQVKLF